MPSQTTRRRAHSTSTTGAGIRLAPERAPRRRPFAVIRGAQPGTDRAEAFPPIVRDASTLTHPDDTEQCPRGIFASSTLDAGGGREVWAVTSNGRRVASIAVTERASIDWIHAMLTVILDTLDPIAAPVALTLCTTTEGVTR